MGNSTRADKRKEFASKSTGVQPLRCRSVHFSAGTRTGKSRDLGKRRVEAKGNRGQRTFQRENDASPSLVGSQRARQYVTPSATRQFSERAGRQAGRHRQSAQRRADARASERAVYALGRSNNAGRPGGDKSGRSEARDNGVPSARRGNPAE